MSQEKLSGKSFSRSQDNITGGLCYRGAVHKPMSVGPTHQFIDVYPAEECGGGQVCTLQCVVPSLSTNLIEKSHQNLPVESIFRDKA